MPIFSCHELRRIRDLDETKFNKMLGLFGSYPDSEKTEFDIFLSHSFVNKEVVGGLFFLLVSMGYRVYVDWIVDPQLDRNDVSKEVAETIRKRMKASKTLLLALSEDSRLSTWVTWELGYLDGKTQQCALVPISHDNEPVEKFERTEYLKLYPYLKMPRKKMKEVDFKVVDSKFEYANFRDWMKNGKVNLHFGGDSMY